MTLSIKLPQADRTLRSYTLREPPAFSKPRRLESRVIYAAAHVVADPFAENCIGAPAKLDWSATLAFRQHLWSLGLGVAEAMDTAQRGMGLDWTVTSELIGRSAADAKHNRFAIVCGAGTDNLPDGHRYSICEIVNAYLEQCEVVENAGAGIVLMASRALAASADGPDDYARVYESVLTKVSRPVILHWLGTMFDPALSGYWGDTNVDRAADICLKIIRDHSAKVEGIKLSLLDKEREVGFRERLPAGTRLYTGDDFNYPELIAGNSRSYSHALLGIFDGIAPAAAAAVSVLDQGDSTLFNQILEPTVPLSRHIFAPPTYYYKTGLTFLAYLNGHQNHFRMVGGFESARSVIHMSDLLVLADCAGVLRDPDLAVERMRKFLSLSGIH
jgi:Protein of unknown function (DUF993)